MTAIVCVDEAWGMAFHGRRQSRDRAVCARILEDAAGRRLWMSRDTLRLFEAPYPELSLIHIFKKSAALWKNSCISFGGFFLKNSGLAVISVSTNRVLSLRVRQPACSIRFCIKW